MNTLVHILCLMIFGASCVSGCNLNGTLIDACQCVVKKYMDVGKSIWQELPSQMLAIGKNLGIENVEEWNAKAVEKVMIRWAKEFEKLKEDDRNELLREYVELDWKRLFIDNMMKKLEEDPECLNCCEERSIKLVNMIRPQLGLFE